MAANTMDGRGPASALRARPAVRLSVVFGVLVVAALVVLFLLNPGP